MEMLQEHFNYTWLIRERSGSFPLKQNTDGFRNCLQTNGPWTLWFKKNVYISIIMRRMNYCIKTYNNPWNQFHMWYFHKRLAILSFLCKTVNSIYFHAGVDWIQFSARFCWSIAGRQIKRKTSKIQHIPAIIDPKFHWFYPTSKVRNTNQDLKIQNLKWKCPYVYKWRDCLQIFCSLEFH